MSLIYQLNSYFIIYLELKMKRSFFRTIKKLMTVYVFIYLGFTVGKMPYFKNTLS